MSKKGFTLIELLVVIGIIAILAAIVVIAVNPGRQFAQARNAQRWSDVNAMLNAVHQYAVDNQGAVPATIDTDDATVQVIGTGGTGGCPTDCTGTGKSVADCLNLSDDLVGANQTYLTGIPTDPSDGTAAVTNYYVNQEGTRRITVGACSAEEGETITVTR